MTMRPVNPHKPYRAEPEQPLAIPKPGKREKRPKVKQARVVSVAVLDKWFSRFVRKRDTKAVGVIRIGRCYTCEKALEYDKLECGHYIGRQHYATRWDARNCRAQCVACNHFNEGEKGIFRKKLVQEYGEDEVSRMEALRRTGKKPKPWEALEILDRVKKDLEKLA